jgi:N-glycosylase/DNA lyase
MENSIKKPDFFDLGATLDCGQCFRWEFYGGIWKGIVRGKSVWAHEDRDRLFFGGFTEKEFSNYFDLETDYCHINAEISKIHPFLTRVAEKSRGVRIVQQEPWEALCSFIISQNNNIPRIKTIIKTLCARFGGRFPNPTELCGFKTVDLEFLRAGYRTEYIIAAAQKVVSGEIDFEKLRSLPLVNAEKELMEIRGVGKKVANCVLLYGLHRLNAFPEDVWIRRIIKKEFNGYTAESFGSYGGVSQQYLYAYHP